MSAPRSVLVPFEQLLSELCGFPVAADEPILFDRVSAKSACWRLTWGEHMDDRGLLFGPERDLNHLLMFGERRGTSLVVEGREVVGMVAVDIRLRDPKSEVLAIAIREVIRRGATNQYDVPLILTANNA